MGEMDPVVARGVVPAAMHIDICALATGDLQVSIGLVHKSTRPLALEVIDDVRKSVALKNVVVDREWTGTRFAFTR